MSNRATRPPVRNRAALLRHNALLQRAEHVAQLGSWEWCVDTGEVLWSDNLCRLFGFEPGDLVPTLEWFFTRAHPEDRMRLERTAGHLAGGVALSLLEFRIVRLDGSVRRMRTTIAAVDGSRPRRVVGSIQDITERRGAEREIALRVAVSDALVEWEGWEHGAQRLLRRLAAALDFVVGVLWVPRGHVLVMRGFWHAPALVIGDLEALTRALHLPRGAGLPGEAWESAQPIRRTRITPDGDDPRRAAAATEAGLRGALVLPAIHDDETIAVLEFFSREEGELTDRLMRSLRTVGHELGHFFAGLHEPTALTARELEVLQLVAQGNARPQIAAGLVVSPSTVKTHLEHIYDKLGVPDRASAVAEALRGGLID